MKLAYKPLLIIFYCVFSLLGCGHHYTYQMAIIAIPSYEKDSLKTIAKKVLKTTDTPSLQVLPGTSILFHAYKISSRKK